MRNEAGIVGTTDWRNRNAIRRGGTRRGISGSGLTTGIQTISAVTTSTVWAAKWAQPDSRVRSTTAGQWTSTMVTLKTTSAGKNRHNQRTDLNSQRGERAHRASHAGVPSRISGADTIVKVRCWTMWTLYR